MTASTSPPCPPPRLEGYVVPDVPRIAAGDDVARIAAQALETAGLAPQDGDVLCVTSKLLSRAEDRWVCLRDVEPGARAQALAAETGKDPRLVELVLGESQAVSRAAPGVLIVRHRLGFVSANGGIDASNVGPDGDRVLLLPENPDRSAEALRRHLCAHFDTRMAVVITDSHGRPFRLGSVGIAIGCAGLPALLDLRGRKDLDGRPLQHTETALADQLASLADLLCGQADEGTPMALIRGANLDGPPLPARALCRVPEKDLYA